MLSCVESCNLLHAARGPLCSPPLLLSPSPSPNVPRTDVERVDGERRAQRRRGVLQPAEAALRDEQHDADGRAQRAQREKVERGAAQRRPGPGAPRGDERRPGREQQRADAHADGGRDRERCGRRGRHRRVCRAATAAAAAAFVAAATTAAAALLAAAAAARRCRRAQRRAFRRRDRRRRDAQQRHLQQLRGGRVDRQRDADAGELRRAEAACGVFRFVFRCVLIRGGDGFASLLPPALFGATTASPRDAQRLARCLPLPPPPSHP